MSCVCMLQRGHSGDECVLASTLCKYDLRKGDLFVLSWAKVRRVWRGALASLPLRQQDSHRIVAGGSYDLLIFDCRLLWQTVSNAADISTDTKIV